jgi:dimethylhistidine N-methyltransferase
MFYDRHGSRLFERITQLPEYYLTRTERNILANSAPAIITRAHGDGSRSLRLVELGAGTASKTSVLLDAIVRLRGGVLYMPVDVSRDALDIARETIGSSLPGVRVEPMVGNYVTHPPQLESFAGTTVALYLGSSIGNFSREEAGAILENLRFQLRSGDALLLGTDMVKDESIMLAAYDDRDGITAAFNLNILHRLNRELGADFDPSNFQHHALWNRTASRIEMHLQSSHDQHVRIMSAGLDLRFTAFETIHTENSYKFTHQTIRMLLDDAGFAVEHGWTDSRDWYAVTLARVP